MGITREEQIIKAIVGEWHHLPQEIIFIKTPLLPESKKGEHGKWEWYYTGNTIYYNVKEFESESL